MKKFFTMLLAVVGMLLNVTAGETTKTCKISGDKDGATVVASIIEIGDGYVLVELSNDGDSPINVTVNVWKDGAGCGNERGGLVPKQSSITIKIVHSWALANDRISSYSITTLRGERCQ